ncbi:MAG: protein kinase [Myxococcota bacterium]
MSTVRGARPAEGALPTDDPIPPQRPPPAAEPRPVRASIGNQIDLADGVTPRTPRRDPLIGKVLDQRYRIVSLLARGGMGRVYRAEQEPHGRIVAVKVLDVGLEHDDDQEFRQRFIREAETCARLTHPHTVRVFDYGETWDHVLFIAMEYLEGRNLYQAIQTDAPMDPARVIRIGRQVASSLREAHALGLIHRDLKPSNVILTRPGGDEEFVKVVDFGLVKEIRGNAELTRADALVGSPSYMSPEQIRSTDLDQRSDIYSLGVLLYACLTGRAPFTGPTSLTVLMGHLNHAPPPMASVCPSMKPTPALEAVVMRCLAKAPADRYEHMEDVLRALQACGDSLRHGATAVTVETTGSGFHPDAAGPRSSSPDSSSPHSTSPRSSRPPGSGGRNPLNTPSEVSLVLPRSGPSAVLAASIGIGVLLGFFLAVGGLAWIALRASEGGAPPPTEALVQPIATPGEAAVVPVREPAPVVVDAAPVVVAAPLVEPPRPPAAQTAEPASSRQTRAPSRSTGTATSSAATSSTAMTGTATASEPASTPSNPPAATAPSPDAPTPDTTAPAPSGARRQSDVRDPWGQR